MVDDKNLIVPDTKPLICCTLEVCRLWIGIFFFHFLLHNKNVFHTVGLYKASHKATNFHLLFSVMWVESPHHCRGKDRIMVYSRLVRPHSLDHVGGWVTLAAQNQGSERQLTGDLLWRIIYLFFEISRNKGTKNFEGSVFSMNFMLANLVLLYSTLKVLCFTSKPIFIYLT